MYKTVMRRLIGCAGWGVGVGTATEQVLKRTILQTDVFKAPVSVQIERCPELSCHMIVRATPD